MSTLALITDAIQAIAATVPTITRAPAAMAYPAAINAVDCPFAFTWPALGTWEVVGLELAQTRQTFDLIVLVAPVAQGYRPEVLQRAITVAEELRTAFLLTDANQTLGNTVEEVEAITFSGLQDIVRYADVDYFAARLAIAARLKEIAL